MKSIILSLKNKKYPIYFSDSKNRLGQILSKNFRSSKWIVVTNPTVDKLYGSKIRKELKGLGEVATVLIPDGEQFKTLQTVEKIYQQFSNNKVDRKTPIVALGGGVVGDVAGFAAATYLRGIPLIQIPTTLLSQVDSSVGGKTGVDLSFGKNLVGAFYQPHLVWIDTEYLSTLPRREILGGAAEVIKYGAIRSPSLFALLEKRIEDFLDLNPSLIQKIIHECVQIKAEVVEEDEKETKGVREILNFGHTLGHAIETVSNYKIYNHGEAISIGMVFAAELSEQLGLLGRESSDRLKDLLQTAALPSKVPDYPLKKYLEAMSLDKKMNAGKIRYVLLKKIGATQVKELELKEVGKVLTRFLK